MGKQIALIATENDLKALIAGLIQKFPDMYIDNCYSRWGLTGFFVKSRNVKYPEGHILCLDRGKPKHQTQEQFDNIELKASRLNEERHELDLGRIYIMTETDMIRNDRWEPLYQSNDLIKRYNYLASLVKKMCVRQYGTKTFRHYALPEGDREFYPVHDEYRTPVYLPDKKTDGENE